MDSRNVRVNRLSIAGGAVAAYGEHNASNGDVGRAVAVGVTDSMFNRPRFLVPPHLRGQPGALSRHSPPEDRRAVHRRRAGRG